MVMPASLSRRLGSAMQLPPMLTMDPLRKVAFIKRNAEKAKFEDMSLADRRLVLRSEKNARRNNASAN